MSTEIFRDKDEDGNVIEVSITDNNKLYLFSSLNKEDGDDWVNIVFQPDKNGFDMVTKLIDALNNWKNRVPRG